MKLASLTEGPEDEPASPAIVSVKDRVKGQEDVNVVAKREEDFGLTSLNLKGAVLEIAEEGKTVRYSFDQELKKFVKMEEVVAEKVEEVTVEPAAEATPVPPFKVFESNAPKEAAEEEVTKQEHPQAEGWSFLTKPTLVENNNNLAVNNNYTTGAKIRSGLFLATASVAVAAIGVLGRSRR
jgi:hypothetical protein